LTAEISSSKGPEVSKWSSAILAIREPNLVPFKDSNLLSILAWSPELLFNLAE